MGEKRSWSEGEKIFRIVFLNSPERMPFLSGSAWVCVVLTAALVVHSCVLAIYGDATEQAASLGDSRGSTMRFTWCVIVNYIVWIRVWLYVGLTNRNFFDEIGNDCVSFQANCMRFFAFVSSLGFVGTLLNETGVMCQTAHCLPRTPLQACAFFYLAIIALPFVVIFIALVWASCFADCTAAYLAPTPTPAPVPIPTPAPILVPEQSEPTPSTRPQSSKYHTLDIAPQ